ncbi:MAG TPA: cation:proton antiporter [Candidatus Dormibacteraeota bacterium]|nr:cation:proton antiporter [Candidatus Dormibacteraeota bacterium]
MTDMVARYPALSVELGAVFVLIAAFASRILLNRLGIPSIVTLLGFGLIAGPSGIDFVRLDLTNPGTRALLQLAVVIVLFEATLRLDLRGVPKTTIALLAVAGPALTLAIVPRVVQAYHFSHLLASMIAAICIVTGPTVIGPLMARVRPRSSVAHLLESEGLVLDALGVIIAAVVFATYTSRPGTPLEASWQVTQRIGTGIVLGAAWGVLGRYVLTWTARWSSDISKVGVLLLGLGAYATSEWVSHESGLVAVVLCGFLLDFRVLPHERLVRAFKEDLSMLALSTVFVLLASQIRVEQLGPLVIPAMAIVGALVGIRVVTVALATFRSAFTLPERLLTMSVFPRGIVAVSLATYYATQIPAWGLRGGDRLAGILFLVVVFTIAISTPSAIAVALRLRLQMPTVVIAGITPATLESARRYKRSGHTPVLIDLDEQAVALARSHDFEAVTAIDRLQVARIVRERGAKILIVDSTARWDDFDRRSLPDLVTVLGPEG